MSVVMSILPVRRYRPVVIHRPAIAAGYRTRITQCAPMRRQISAARHTTFGAMQVDTEEFRIFAVDLAVERCWIGGTGKLPDAVNLDGIEPTRGIPDQSVGVADCWEGLCGSATACSYSPLERCNNGWHDGVFQKGEFEPPAEPDARS